MSQGVIILSLKKPSYSQGAFNLALSIKHYNPSINITLVTDNEHQKHYRPEHYLVFDAIKTISPSHYISEGMFQPALAKININKAASLDSPSIMAPSAASVIRICVLGVNFLLALVFLIVSTIPSIIT